MTTCLVTGGAGFLGSVVMGRSLTLLDLIQALNTQLGTNIQPRFAPPRTGDVLHSLADARPYFGYEPLVDLAEGLRRTVAYYRTGTQQDATVAVPASR